jgi:hypothetical protein
VAANEPEPRSYIMRGDADVHGDHQIAVVEVVVVVVLVIV